MRYSLAICGAIAACAMSAPAFAANFFPGNPEFTVTGDGTTGTDVVSANLGRSGLAQANNQSDSYFFRIGPMLAPGVFTPIGSGQGTVQTLVSLAGQATDVDLTEVIFSNGVDPSISLTIGNGGITHATLPGGFQFDFAAVGGVTIYSGIVNTLTINYNVPLGNGAYSGTLGFTPNAAVPEPGTWALFLAGFAVLGFALRRKPRENVRVRYAF